MLDFMLINLIFKFQHICSGIGKPLSQSDVAQKNPWISALQPSSMCSSRKTGMQSYAFFANKPNIYAFFFSSSPKNINRKFGICAQILYFCI